MRATFVYANPRARLAADVAAGRAPDTGLLGANHLAAHGFDVRIHEPLLRRRQRASGLRHRVTWNLRELALPLELGGTDVAVTPLGTLFPLAARARRGPRVVVLAYGVATLWDRASGRRRRLVRASLGSAAAVVCLADSQRDALIERTGLDPERLHVVPIGADERFLTPRPRTGDYVLAVGKDMARDYETLAAAAAGLDLPVQVVAEPRNVERLRLPPSVEVRSRVGWDELRELYAGARVVALTLRQPDRPVGTEASGLTALVEAMAMGKAVVVTERPVFRDYAADGDSCVTVPAEDPTALRAALERVAGDDALAAALGARARAVVEERLTTRHLAARLAPIVRAAGG